MQRILHIGLILTLQFMLTPALEAQKKISEFTIVYNYTMSNAGKENASFNATNSVYIKGKQSRSDIISSLISFTTIYDAGLGTGVVLRELSGQKLLIRMNAENWQDKNRRYENIHFTNTGETKTIAGYKCMRARAVTPDSLVLDVYYTKDLIPENKSYDPQFRNLDGLPLEYELQKRGTTIRFVLASINLNPVPASRFDIPKSGYREMTYEESKKLNSGTN